MNRRKLLQIAGLVFALWLLGTPGMASGQGSTWVGTSLAQMVEAAKWRLGSLRVNAAIELMNAGHDSDVYYGYTAEPVPDYTFSAGLPVQVLLPVSKRIVLDIFDRPQYVFYVDTKKERAWNNTFRGQIHFALDRFYIQAGGGLANVRRRMSPELNINIREKANSLNGLVLWQASRATSFALLYGGTTFDYGDAEYGGTSIAEALNRREDNFDVITYLQLNPRVRFYANGQYGRYAFAEAASSFKDARSYGLFGGLDFIPSEEGASRVGGIEGSANLGYMKFDLLDPGQIDGSGFAGDVNLSVGIMRLTTANISFSRGFQFSVYSGATYYISTAYGAGITRLLSRRASLTYELSFGSTSYPRDEAGGDIPQGISNRYTTHMANLNIKLSRNLTITFFGTIGKRLLGGSAPARNRNFFGFNLIYGASTGTITAPTGGSSR
jgi:hypothetical protein